MDLFPSIFSDLQGCIAYIIAIVVFLIPLLIGIPMIWRNRHLTSTAKICWTLAFIIAGLLPFLLYFAISQTKCPTAQE